jgi:hypothetical protein
MPKSSLALILALTTSVSVGAQQRPGEPPPAVVGKPQGAPPTLKTPPPAVVARSPEPPAQLVNIKVDLTIVDQTGATESAKKSVSLIVADRQSGFIRSTVNPKEGGQVRLNVDARPQILPNGHVRLGLSLEYPTLNQAVNMILDPGKPLVISQAADPTSDRKISVEVRATLLK